MLEPGDKSARKVVTGGLDPALWQELRSAKDPGIREQLIGHHLTFARILAAKAYAKRVSAEMEFADFMQYATIGLMEAVDRFDPDHGVKFETFAGPRITGAILNGIASFTEKQEQISARKRILADRTNSLKGKAADQSDSAALFGRLAEVAIGLALGFVLEDSGMYQADEPMYADNTYCRIEMKQLRQQIKEALSRLPENHERVIAYHYLNHIGFDEIAKILGVSKGRVSQIHKDALARLKKFAIGDRSMDLKY